MAPVIKSQVGDEFYSAACDLVRLAADVFRDNNTDEFMEQLAVVLNRMCDLVGERDAIAYVKSQGIFMSVKRSKSDAFSEGEKSSHDQ